MLARIRHLLAGVRHRGVYDVKRLIHSNKGMMWALGLAARASQHEQQIIVCSLVG